MPFRLLLQLPGGPRRLPLPAGASVLGSADGCELTVSHLTVSRRHARFVVEGGSVTVEDLGSSNGTRVDGVRITAATPLRPGADLALGGLRGTLEEVAAEDLVALTAAVPAPPTSSRSASVAHPTIAGAALEEFLLRTVPAVVDEVLAGVSGLAVAQKLGAEIHRTFPCRWVEILDGATGAVLFRGGTPDGGSTPGDLDLAEQGVRFVGSCLSPLLARQLEPLARMVLRLVAAAAGREPSRRKVPADSFSPARAPVSLHHATLDRRLAQLLERTERVARGDIGVLIRGESGTGKEVLARFVHEASPFARGAFVAINCASLPRDLLEAELFGIERAVATGVEARPGKFESAHGGTLFLDEIGDMALETQAKILRVLQEGEVYRLGSREPRPARPRIVAATHQDLEEMQRTGAFRRDLYYRVAGFVVELPALRERAIDIPNLAAGFLAQAGEKRGVRFGGLSVAAAERLARHDWPGNIRELKHEIERAALFLGDGELLESTGLDSRLGRGAGPTADLPARLEAFERAEIERALIASEGDVSRAAAALGIGRSTLYRRLQILGVTPVEPSRR